MINFASPDDDPRYQKKERDKLLKEAFTLNARVSNYTARMNEDEIERWAKAQDALENLEADRIPMNQHEFRQAIRSLMSTLRNILPTTGFHSSSEPLD